ncbi:MAG: 1-(5-phosphoribosyl)-5-[(5-phosphoribosylamino)methylideneamino] imidazole-4-carboxamide isomerase [Cytophagales bacterium]|nr:MAG: 1-(5-phosphoribosyl)-5-[(5-phosphoribosylamino)methylideneamino] imidazole-4-carboxamide isomerase [Cytophagales bacterium]
MIKIIPAMPIKGGKVVKTRKGDVDDVIIYDKNPLDLAMEFEDAGLTHLHIIDLDGAKQRRVVNYPILELIAKYTKLNIDYTGGISSDGDVRTIFEFGAKTMTLASVAIEEPEKFKSWLISYGANKIILAADALDNIVRTKGWKNNVGINLFEHIANFTERGVSYVKTTEIERDGTMLGPKFELYQELITQFPEVNFLACGGIRNADDIAKLEELGVYGVIFSKSFYEGKIQLSDLKIFL